MVIEICCDQILSAYTALAVGATRIELCSALTLGGLTPSIGTFSLLHKKFPSQIRILVRPRMGGFSYSVLEKNTILEDIELFFENGADTFVVGALREDNQLDIDFLHKILDTFPKGKFIFHRAFDETPDLYQTLNDLIELGFQGVLTSGGKKSALEGADIIKNLVNISAGKIEIIAGGGITAQNFSQTMILSQADAMHMSLRIWREPKGKPNLNLNSHESSSYGYWDLDEIALKKVLDESSRID